MYNIKPLMYYKVIFLNENMNLKILQQMARNS